MTPEQEKRMIQDYNAEKEEYDDYIGKLELAMKMLSRRTGYSLFDLKTHYTIAKSSANQMDYRHRKADKMERY